MRTYIAGKMSGEPDFGYPKFHKYARLWRAFGHDVLNPAERFNGRTDLDYEIYINHSMIDLIACDAVAAIPGWEESKGASLEIQYARTVGKPVYNADEPFRADGGGQSRDAGSPGDLRVAGSELSTYGEPLGSVLPV